MSQKVKNFSMSIFLFYAGLIGSAASVNAQQRLHISGYGNMHYH